MAIFECNMSFQVNDDISAETVARYLEEKLTCCTFVGGPNDAEHKSLNESLKYYADENGSFSITDAKFI